MISKKYRIQAFVDLGEKINSLSETDLDVICDKARSSNQWFTKNMVETALTGISKLLTPESFIEWANYYNEPSSVRKVGIVMAGNIPLVGFHDFLCVLVSGHQAVVKLSSQDAYLPILLAEWLTEINDEFKNEIIFADKLNNIDAVIATGSDNSARYFHQYFNHLPNIIRKNRTSVAIIKGDETKEDLSPLGVDIFTYFGLGCRNVSKVYVPEGFELPLFLDALASYEEVIQHHKYCNNYDYNKSIYLVNREDHLDNGFLLLKQDPLLVSPLAVVYYEFYSDIRDLDEKLLAESSKIQ